MNACVSAGGGAGLDPPDTDPSAGYDLLLTEVTSGHGPHGGHRFLARTGTCRSAEVFRSVAPRRRRSAHCRCCTGRGGAQSTTPTKPGSATAGTAEPAWSPSRWPRRRSTGRGPPRSSADPILDHVRVDYELRGWYGCFGSTRQARIDATARLLLADGAAPDTLIRTLSMTNPADPALRAIGDAIEAEAEEASAP